MRTEIFENMTVTVLSDNGQSVKPGRLTSANVVLKAKDQFVVMPQDCRPWKRAEHNPLLYAGKFFSSRQKQNGNISLHGVINGSTNLYEAYRQARLELDEFFRKLEVLV